MKKFKFGLESVLKVRNIHKKLAEREVALTQSRINANQRQLEQNQEAYTETFRMMHPSDGHNPFWADLALRYQAGLKARGEQLEAEKKELQERLEGDKVALTRKMKEEMVMEKLKELKRAEHQILADAEVQAEIEELDILKRGNINRDEEAP